MRTAKVLPVVGRHGAICLSKWKFNGYMGLKRTWCRFLYLGGRAEPESGE